MREIGVISELSAQHDQCPICYSKARQRTLHAFLVNYCKLEARSWNVLSIAPEYSISIFLRRCAKLNLVCGDLEPERYKKRSDRFVCLDLTSLPFGSESFDLVICSHVLEHIVDDRTAMHEMFRVLRPGGRAAIMVPTALKRSRTLEDPGVVDPAERSRRFGQHDHVRVYARDIVDRLAEAGFTITEFNGPLGQPIPQAGLWHLADDIVFDAVKRQ